MEPIYKYPRTPHLEGSGLQRDDDLVTEPLRALYGKNVMIEEKMDGANAAISFDEYGQLRLQSRGHYLQGGPRERQFALFKSWANRYARELWNVLGQRYVLYGEWLYGKHTIFYTDLPHYFLEFDILDTEKGEFLSTSRRRDMLKDTPFVASVSVLHEGTVASFEALQSLIGPSRFIAPNHRELLQSAAVEVGMDTAQVLRETDASGLMEGLYIKVEEAGAVKARYKYVRAGFLQTVLDSGSHWMNRPLLPNRLREGGLLW